MPRRIQGAQGMPSVCTNGLRQRWCCRPVPVPRWLKLPQQQSAKMLGTQVCRATGTCATALRDRWAHGVPLARAKEQGRALVLQVNAPGGGGTMPIVSCAAHRHTPATGSKMLDSTTQVCCARKPQELARLHAGITGHRAHPRPAQAAKSRLSVLQASTQVEQTQIGAE